MADHVAFVNGPTDCELFGKYYSDSTLVRIPLENATKIIPMLPKGPKVWIDAGIDGLDRPYADSKNDTWKQHIQQFPYYEKIGDTNFHLKPNKEQVEKFVFAALDKCVSLTQRNRNFITSAVTVPQLPIADDGRRNKINRALAKAAGKWKAKKQYHHAMILPAIFTSQRQLNLKTDRNNKCKLIAACYENSGADTLWAVDSSLQDQAGSPTFRNKRFPGILDFHKEIANCLPDNSITIAGPYWGLNLVLWVKGLCHYPAIGIGGAYQYHLSNGQKRSANVRLAIPPLCRWAKSGSGLRAWLLKAAKKIDKSEPAYKDIAYLSDNFSTLGNDKARSREQIAKFYKKWFDEIEKFPQAGRALALYQMLSAAYVLGKTLPELPQAEKTARRPERVAEYLMLNCL